MCEWKQHENLASDGKIKTLECSGGGGGGSAEEREHIEK